MYVAFTWKSRLMVAVYDKQEVLSEPAWTLKTIKPLIDAGLVAPWRAFGL